MDLSERTAAVKASLDAMPGGVAQAMSGAVYFSGTLEQPVRSAAPWVDFGTASLLALGVAAALRARETTGKGQLVEGALLRTALTFFSPTLIEEAALRLDRKPSLNRSQTAGPSDIFKAKDGWITVAVNGDPLADIRELEHVHFVMKEGMVYKQGD